MPNSLPKLLGSVSRQVGSEKFVLVSYGHSVQINCSMTKSDVNVTVFVKRFSTRPTKVVIDNVKWRQRKDIFTLTVTEPLDGGRYSCEVVNKTGYKRTTKGITIIPIAAPRSGKLISRR